MSVNIRSLIFWALDELKGKGVRKHYRDIQNKMESAANPSDELSNILQYAVAHVPFYSEMKGLRFDQYPIMNKEKYNAEFKRMRSDEYAEDDMLHWVRTSGSTGTPFSVPKDKNKVLRTRAELLYFHDKSGWHLGDRYFFIRAWAAYDASKKKQLVQNFRAFDATNFNKKSKEKFFQAINNDHNLKVVFGYSSVLTDFAEYLESCGKKVSNKNLSLVVVDSDTLLPGAKEKIEAVFGCKVMNRYDNEEHGVLACMLPNTDYWKVNTASYYIELLKINSDEPCKPGEVGRVVVTDLTNKAFPFIRYDVGDLAFSNSYNGRYLTRIDGLEGKAKDIILDTDGNRIGNVTFAAYFELFLEIKKYQLIQVNEKEYRIKVELKPGMEIDKSKLIDKMKECLGKDALISVEVVEKIESTKTGKYQPVISLFNRM